ncbi:hypothetical protein ACVMHY_007842 [Bradyrhizobium barranii subsp. barranii]
MKILITSSLYPTPLAPKVVGGAETFVRRLAETLVGQNDGVEVIRAASASNQQMETCNGIDVYSAPVHNIYPVLFARGRLRGWRAWCKALMRRRIRLRSHPITFNRERHARHDR